MPTLSEPRPCRGRPLYRERFLPLVCRRTTAAMYRRSAKYSACCQRVGPAGRLPVPSVVESLAVYLSQVLPPSVLRRLGTEGVFGLARVLDRLPRVLLAGARLAFRLVRGVWRACRRLGRRRAGASAIRSAGA